MSDAQTFARAVELQRAGQLDQAAALYYELSQTTLTTNLIQNLAGCLVPLKRYAEAECWLRLALEQRPEDASLLEQFDDLQAARSA
jgi:hypothetical protein